MRVPKIGFFRFSSFLSSGALLFFLILLIYLAASTAFLFLGGNSLGGPQFWKGFYPLILPSSSVNQEVLSLLQDQGGEDLVHAGSAEVLYMAIPSLASLPVKDLEGSLPPGDLRRDPFLDRITALFQREGQSIIYLPSRRSPGFFQRQIKKQPLLAGAWLPDYQPLRGLPGLVIFGVVVFLSLFLFPGRRIAGLVRALPWGFFLLYTNSTALGAVVLLWLLSPSMILRLKNQGWRWQLLTFAAAVLLALGAGVYLVVSLPKGILLGMLAGTLGISEALGKSCVLAFPALGAGPSGTDHPLFEPLPLLGSSSPSSPPVLLLPRLSTVVLVLPLLLELLPGSLLVLAPPPALPSAGGPLGPFGDRGVYEELFNRRLPQSLPDAGGMLASQAGQETFLYGGGYRFPRRGEVTTLSVFRREGEGIARGERPVVVFDEVWFQNFEKALEKNPLGTLFLAQGGPAPVGLTGEVEITGRGFFSWGLLLMMLSVLAAGVSFVSPPGGESLHLFAPFFPRKKTAA